MWFGSAIFAIGAGMLYTLKVSSPPGQWIGYQILAAPPLAVAEGAMNTIMPYVIIIVALALFLYARVMKAKGVLR